MAEDGVKKMNDDIDAVQSQIETAMRSRVSHFKQQAEFVSFSSFLFFFRETVNTLSF